MDINKYFDGIYIVSYVKNIDRRKELSSELLRIGLLKYEYAYSYNTTIIKNPNNIDPISLSKSFTHYDIIKKAYELGYEHILILEDDAHFLHNVEEIHNIILENEKLGYDINFYDYQYRYGENVDLIKIFLSSCYSLNRQGMNFFIRNFENLPFLIDGYVSMKMGDHHAIPNTILFYLDGCGSVTVLETDTTINLSEKRICIQSDKFHIYNDYANTCNISEYNIVDETEY